MSERLPGYADIKGMFEAIKVDRAAGSEDIQRQKEELMERIEKLKTELGDATSKAQEMNNTEKELDRIMEQQEVMESVGMMRDYGIAVESKDEKVIEESEKALRTLLDELMRKSRNGHVEGFNLKAPNFHGGFFKDLTPEVRAMVINRAMWGFKMWATKGKEGYVPEDFKCLMQEIGENDGSGFASNPNDMLIHWLEDGPVLVKHEQRDELHYET